MTDLAGAVLMLAFTLGNAFVWFRYFRVFGRVQAYVLTVALVGGGTVAVLWWSVDPPHRYALIASAALGLGTALLLVDRRAAK